MQLAEGLALLVLHIERDTHHALGLDHAIGVVTEPLREFLVHPRYPHPVLDFSENLAGFEKHVGDFLGFGIELRHFFKRRRRGGELTCVFKTKTSVIDRDRPEVGLRIICHDAKIRLTGIVPLEQFLIAFCAPELPFNEQFRGQIFLEQPLIHKDRLRPFGKFLICQPGIEQRDVGDFRIRKLQCNALILGSGVFKALLLFIHFTKFINRFGDPHDGFLLVAAFPRHVLELAVPDLRLIKPFLLIVGLRDHADGLQGMRVLGIAVDNRGVYFSALFKHFVIIIHRGLDEQHLRNFGALRIDGKVIVARSDHQFRCRRKRFGFGNDDISGRSGGR